MFTAAALAPAATTICHLRHPPRPRQRVQQQQQQQQQLAYICNVVDELLWEQA